MIPLYLTKGCTINVNGYKLKIIPNDKGISTELRVFKIHEPITTKLLCKELKKGMVCIDASSNIGYYAILESKLVGSKGRVIAFEPAPVNFAYLKYNVIANKLSNIETYNMAIGDTDGCIDFLIWKKSNLCRVMRDHETDDFDSMAAIKVPVKTLDTFIQEHHISRIDFIRMDVEGYEYNVYQGITNTIKRFKPNLLLEIHPEFMGLDKTIQLLNKLRNDGYEIKYCVDRVLDYSLVGSTDDVMDITLNKLIVMVHSRLIVNAFNVYLTQSNRNPNHLGLITTAQSTDK